MLSLKAKRINPLISSALSDQFSTAEMASLSRFGTVVELPAGRILFAQGTPGREAMLVLEGDVVIERDDRVVTHSGAGEFVGEIAVITQKSRPVSSITMTPVVAVVFAKHEFDSLLFANPDIERAVVRAGLSRFDSVVETTNVIGPVSVAEPISFTELVNAPEPVSVIELTGPPVPLALPAGSTPLAA